MRHTIFAGLVLSIVLFAGAGDAWGSCQGHPGYREGFLLVRFAETGVSPQAGVIRQNVVSAAGGGSIKRMYNTVPGLALVQLPAGVSTATARSKFQVTIGVRYAELDRVYRIQAVPDDPMFDQLWGLRNIGQTGGTPGADINAVPAWDIHTGSRNVVVAVIDTGVDYTHPDLAENMWINEAEYNGTPGVDDDGNGYVDDIYGYDFVNETGDPMDDHSHGTHVAGTIGAVGNNSLGVVGVNWQVRLMALKFLDEEGSGFTSDAIRAIEYATMMGAHITNNSWGGYGYSQALYEAIVISRNAGVLFVAAAGNEFNDNDTMPAYPASYPVDNIISVLATTHFDDKAGFSNWGRTTVHLGAPGQNILSTVPGDGYASFSGTSMAAPHVAGAAALVMAENPGLNYSEVRDILLSTGDRPGSLMGLCTTEGRLNVYEALQASQLGDVFPPTPNPMEWKVEPVAVGTTTVYMEAVRATDPSGVMYQFECLNDIRLSTGYNPQTGEIGWQTSPVYHVGGLTPTVQYAFQVKAKDNSVNANETMPSNPAVVSTPEVDDLPPQPNPSQWKGYPVRAPGSNIRIHMEAARAYDEIGSTVYYYFECVDTDDPAYADDPGLLSTGPQTNPIHFVHVTPVSSPGYFYTFRTRAEDHLGNMTEWSEEATAIMAPDPKTRYVGPGAAYSTIQSAINASNHGDTVVVHPGVYREININFKGKRITVRSINPDDPSIVASTVIDCEEPEVLWAPEPRRAFLFVNGEGRDSVLSGITIRNATALDDPTFHHNTYVWSNEPRRGNGAAYSLDGDNAYGGAIYIGRKIPDPGSINPTYPDYISIAPASPTIRNCVFVNCTALGAYAYHGLDGPNPGNDTPGNHGNRGGDGGNAYGGAIYAVAGSSPLIVKSSFYTCRAIGGNAGHGGNGSGGGGHSDNVDEANGHRGGDGGDGGHGGVAYGGAIYIEPNSLPELYDVIVSDCYVQVGEAGRGGHGGNGSDAKSEGRGGHGGNGGIGGDLRSPDSSGGAVFFGEKSEVIISGSVFENCRVIAELSGDYSGGNGGGGGQGEGWPGGNGGHGGPAFFIPDKMRDIGGVTATGGTGGNGGGGGAQGGNGGFRFGVAGSPGGASFGNHTGIFPSNIYYMSYYWEDTSNIVNPPDDPYEHLNFAYGWDWPETTRMVITTIPMPPDLGIVEYDISYSGIFDGPWSPYYGFINFTETYEVPFEIIFEDPNDPESDFTLLYYYEDEILLATSFDISSLTPTNPKEPVTGAVGGANFYGRNCVVKMENTTIIDNRSFANHGGGELYAKGCDATFINCRFEGNRTLYTMEPYPPDPEDPDLPTGPADRDMNTDYKFEGFGGAIFADQPVRMSFTGCDFVDNQAYSGGGLYLNFGPSDASASEHAALELTNCTFVDNKADYHFNYSYSGGFYAGNSLEPYEEYYFNFLKDHRTANLSEYSSLYFSLGGELSDAYYEYINFITAVYAHTHGRANFYAPVTSNLWDDVLEADRILYGQFSPRYQVSVANCSFSENAAPYGASLYIDASLADVLNSRFVGNMGRTGVGGYAYASDLLVRDSLFDKNLGMGIPSLGNQSQQDSALLTFYGFGGGLFLLDSDLDILNNRFVANEVSGYGGAVYLAGSALSGYSQRVINNLFVENTANLAAGAMVTTDISDVEVVNCTFVDNRVTNMGGTGGALWVNDSFVELRNSIFRDNLAALGPQIAVGDPLSHPWYTPYSTLWAYNSNIQGGEDGVYVGLAGWSWLIYEETNLNVDPLFVSVVDAAEASDRTFYLSHEDAGQIQTSPCYHTGYGSTTWLSDILGFEITTRTDHEPDTDPLNMGIYYTAALPVGEYILTASVFVGDYYPFGTLDVSYLGGAFSVGVEPQSRSINQGVQVTLTARPDEHYRVKRWIGTDNDASVDTVNYVTMSGRRTVQVEFELATAKNLFVPEGYTTIESAVEAARTGDTIVLAPRAGQPYTITSPEGINFGGKQLTLRSVNPKDEYIRANTVIDIQGTRYTRKRGFTFNNGEDPNTVIEGITIRNGFWAGAVGGSAILETGIWPPDPTIDPPPPLRAPSGMDAVGNGYGGAVLVTNGSSPTIRNVVFENCTVAGGIGGDGADGYPQNTQGLTGDIDGQSGGHAGSGTGNGFGGAIAIINGSNPTIHDCVFLNNRATGGWGGIPGHGGFAVGSGRYSWGGDAGYGEGDGRGGAIYIERDCNPTVTDNVFEDNYVRLGYVSAGGLARGGAAYPDPWHEENWPIESRHGSGGWLISYGTVAGGAVFYGENANSYIYNSEFKNNRASLPLPVSITLNYYSIQEDAHDYTHGGAIYMDNNVTLSLEKCKFYDNLGGAIYACTGSALTVDESRFEGNASYDPAEGKGGILNLEDYFGISPLARRQQPAGAITIEAGARFAPTITRSHFVGNLSETSGGAIHTNSNLTVVDSTFAGNDAVLRGGAIYAYRHIPDPSTHTLEVDLHYCEFTHNSSDELGGAVYVKNNILDVQYVQFIGNRAPSGGGLLTVESELTMANALFTANEATGLAPTFQMVTDVVTGILYSILGGVYVPNNYQTVLDEGVGGGLYLVDTKSAIVDTRILNNTAKGANAAGGGLCINGGQSVVTQNLINCLIAGNTSERDGGGIKIMSDASPQFDNCTIADNTAQNLGGGLFIDWTSHPTFVNSIFANNKPTDVYEQPGGALTTDAVYFGNPKFVEGPLGKYYLDPSSPAVDAGNKTAVEVGLHTYTTNPAVPAILDAGIVDLGYHYDDPDTVGTYTLTVIVSGGQGSVSPSSGTYYYGQIVDLSTAVHHDYYLDSWSGGTVNDASKTLTNAVLITGDKTITVKLRQRQTYYVGGSTGFPDLQRAIDAAKDGDNILIYPGLYVPPVGTDGSFIGNYRTITLGGKSLRISSLNPDDENTVRNTVFNQYAFHIFGATEETVIEGITIRNSAGTSSSLSGMIIYDSNPIIRNVIFSECQHTGATVAWTLNCPQGVMDGGNGISILGGAVSVVESSPRFINCKFEDNIAWGGDGQNGANGCAQHPDGGEGGWPGRAYGGAVYVAFSSSPVFENCTFSGNQAIGGVAGNGGNGIVHEGTSYRGGRGGGYLWPDSIENDPTLWTFFDGWEDGDKYGFYGHGVNYYMGFNMYGRYDWDLWSRWFGWDKDEWNNWQDFFASTEYQNAQTTAPKVDGYEEYWKYSGYGGAIYVGYLSDATFINCVFEENRTQGSLSGVGGVSGTGDFPTPNRPLNLPNAGGAVYAAYDSTLVFDNCVFRDNTADTSTVEIPNTYEVSFGGAVAYEFDSHVTFINSDFQGNLATVGGAVFGRDSTVQIADCNALDNEAYLGAGLYFERGSASVTNTVLQFNKAKRPDIVIPEPDEDDDDDDDDVLVVPPADLTVIGQGGGLYAASSNLSLTHSVFMNNRADISGGGLLLIGTVNTPSDVFNNLFIHNRAGRDGAGASVNWSHRAKFRNCTFAHNQCTGYGTDYYYPGSGGGLYIAYNSIADVIDSLFWGNNAVQGSQITVGTGFEFDPRPSTLNIAYSNVQGFGSAGAIYRGQGCTISHTVDGYSGGMFGGNLTQHNPQFVAPPDVEEDDVRYQYYLHTDSPCIDAGSRLATAAGLSQFTTNFMGARDAGEVDLGYHYRITFKVPCSFADIVMDGRIGMEDLVWFANRWLLAPCGSNNDWCQGADLNFDRMVDFSDFALLSFCWLSEDEDPPLPNPSQWAIEPNAVPNTFTSIMMTAVTATDAWRPDDHISYKFECTNVPALSSGWQESFTYERSGLIPGFQYNFTVRSRDVRFDVDEGDLTAVINPTDSSVELGVRPGEKTKPTPSPAAFVEGTPFVSGANRVRMDAVPYDGPSLPSGIWVEYFFEYIGSMPGGLSSNWQISPIYTNTGLTVGLVYEYRVLMRFNTPYGAFAPGEPSPIAAVLVTPVDTTPPEPNPAEFQEGMPFQVQVTAGNWWHVMVAEPASDNDGDDHVNVEYMFRCYDLNGNEVTSLSSPIWRNLENVAGLPNFPNGMPQAGRPHEFWRFVGLSGQAYRWTVQYRDMTSPPNYTVASPLTPISNP